MAHNYQTDPPAFAKDPIAWDYTREKVEAQSGLDYDSWKGPQFAAANRIYQNVRNKYGNSLQDQTLSVPRECANCGQSKPHYADDFVCQTCRNSLEDADTYYEAEEVITSAPTLEEIRQALAEKLSGKPSTPEAVGMPVDAATATATEQTAPASVGNVYRNYSAMNPAKLKLCVHELDAGEGDAVDRVQMRGEDVLDHLEAALRAAQEKGITV